MRSLVSALLFCIVMLAVPSLAGAQNRAVGDDSPLGSCTKSFYLIFDSLTGDFKTSGSIKGNVNLLCDGTWIFADVISWDEKMAYASGANGSLLVTQEGLRVNADRMEMDRQTRLGTFFHAYGTARLTEDDKYHNMFGSMEPEIMFIAEKIEKIGPRSYRLTDGMFSTCVQPNPRWKITGKNATVVLEDHASMKNAALRVKGVPVLYLPYMYYPLKKEDRATGFLIPTYSASGVRGQGFGDAFFWAIDRSQDATFYYTKYTKSGQIGAADYRYQASDQSHGFGYFQLLDESERLAPDGSVERQARRTYQVVGEMRQALPRGFFLTGNSYYISDITTQALYEQNIYNQSRRDRNLTFSVTGPLMAHDKLHITATTSQRDISNGTTFTRKGTLPQVDVTFASRSLRRTGAFSKIYFGAAGQAVYNDVRPDLNQPELDRALWRFNSIATVTAPLSSLTWLDVRGRASWQATNWSQTVDPLTGSPVSTPLTRNLFVLNADVTGPKLERNFSTPDSSYASSFIHEIQPFANINWLSPFNERDRVIQIDPQIDQLVGGTTTINYGLNNVLRAARKANNNRLKEIMRVSISQSWYSNAQAGAIDPNYPTATINTFAPVQFLFSTTLTESFQTRFQVYIDPIVKAIRSYSFYGFWVNGEHLTVEGGWQKRQYLPTVPGYDNPNNASHFINGSATFRLLDGRYGGRYIFNYDLRNTSFLQQRIQGYYSSQCCGISIDYQMMNVSQFQLTGVPRDRRLAITFTLAGIGSFASPLGAFGR